MNINLLNKKTGEAVVDSGVKVKHSQFFFLLNGEHYTSKLRKCSKSKGR